jgi:hypothetical protein
LFRIAGVPVQIPNLYLMDRAQTRYRLDRLIATGMKKENMVKMKKTTAKRETVQFFTATVSISCRFDIPSSVFKTCV